MDSFPAVLLFVLSFTFVSTMSVRRLDQLDEIERLLHRLQNEIDHMRGSDNARRGDIPAVRRNLIDNEMVTSSSSKTTDDRNKDNIRNPTTQFDETTTQQHEKTETTETTVSDATTKFFDSSSSDDSSGPVRTTGPSQTTHPESFHSTNPSRPEVTEGIHQTTTEEKKKEDDEEEDDEVGHLIDDGEKLTRQLKGIFLQLFSFRWCVTIGNLCGMHRSLKCCQGLKCSDIGTCQPY